VVVEARVMKGSFTVPWLTGDLLDRSAVDQQMAAG
jgi:hypothetical protein